VCSSDLGGAGRRPLPQDTAIFDANSFDGAGLKVVMDYAFTANERYCGNIDWSGATNNPEWDPGGAEFYGNITLKSGMTTGGGGGLSYYGRGNSTITTAGVSLSPAVYVYSYGGKLTLGDAITTTQWFQVNLGTFDSANYNITAFNFVVQPGCTATLGTSTVSLTGTSGLWQPGGSRLPTYDNLKTLDWGWRGVFSPIPAKSMDLGTMDLGYMGQPFVSNSTESIDDYKYATFIITDVSATAKSFSGGNYTYNNLYIGSGAGTNVQLNMTGGNATWNNINFYGQGTVYFTANTTTTLRGTFGLWGGYLQTGGNYTKFGGVPGTLATLYSYTSGTPFYLIKESGNVCCDYLSLRDAYVGGGAKFFAGSHTTSVSNNSGWLMTDATDIQA
jgi:hypothetical protein